MSRHTRWTLRVGVQETGAAKRPQVIRVSDEVFGGNNGEGRLSFSGKAGSKAQGTVSTDSSSAKYRTCLEASEKKTRRLQLVRLTLQIW